MALIHSLHVHCMYSQTASIIVVCDDLFCVCDCVYDCVVNVL